MTQPYASGPVFVYVGWNDNSLIRRRFPQAFRRGTPLYLGTGEVAPESEIRRSWEPVMNDLSGGVAHDMVFRGQEAFTNLNLTRWNESVLRLVQDCPYQLGSNGRGYNSAAEMGSLMIQEGLAFSLYLLYGNRNDPAMRDGVNSMPRGFRFPSNTWSEGPDVRQVGSRANKVRLLFHSIPAYDENSATLILYDEDVSAVERVS